MDEGWEGCGFGIGIGVGGGVRRGVFELGRRVYLLYDIRNGGMKGNGFEGRSGGTIEKES